MTYLYYQKNIVRWSIDMSKHPTETEKWLEEVREEIKKLAEVPPHLRNHKEWQRMVEAESRLMRLIAEETFS